MNLYIFVVVFSVSKFKLKQVKHVKYKSALVFWFEVMGTPVFHRYSGGIQLTINNIFREITSRSTCKLIAVTKLSFYTMI